MFIFQLFCCEKRRSGWWDELFKTATGTQTSVSSFLTNLQSSFKHRVGWECSSFYWWVVPHWFTNWLNTFFPFLSLLRFFFCFGLVFFAIQVKYECFKKHFLQTLHLRYQLARYAAELMCFIRNSYINIKLSACNIYFFFTNHLQHLSFLSGASRTEWSER